jgi:hypothetical protein
MTAIADARLRLLADRLHQLGPRPLYEFLRELMAGADLLPRLETYAGLSPLAAFITEFDGDQARALRVIKGGRR